jgi:hypothetical protein
MVRLGDRDGNGAPRGAATLRRPSRTASEIGFVTAGGETGNPVRELRSPVANLIGIPLRDDLEFKADEDDGSLPAGRATGYPLRPEQELGRYRAYHHAGHLSGRFVRRQTDA